MIYPPEAFILNAYYAHRRKVYSTQLSSPIRLAPPMLSYIIRANSKADPVENTRFARNFNRITCKVFEKNHSKTLHRHFEFIDLFAHSLRECRSYGLFPP